MNFCLISSRYIGLLLLVLHCTPSFGGNKTLERALSEKYVESVSYLDRTFPKGKLPEKKLYAHFAVANLSYFLDVSIVGVLAQDGLISEQSSAEEWKSIEKLWIRVLHRLDREALTYALNHVKEVDQFQFLETTPAERLKHVVPSKRLALITALGCEHTLVQ